MAKAEDSSVLEKNVDILIEGMSELRRMFNALKAENEDLKKTVAQLQADAQLATQDTLLPREIREGVSPGQLYTSFVQAFIIGYIGSNPSILMRSGRDNPHGVIAADRAIEFGDRCLEAFRARFGMPATEEPAKKAK